MGEIYKTYNTPFNGHRVIIPSTSSFFRTIPFQETRVEWNSLEAIFAFIPLKVTETRWKQKDEEEKNDDSIGPLESILRILGQKRTMDVQFFELWTVSFTTTLLTFKSTSVIKTLGRKKMMISRQVSVWQFIPQGKRHQTYQCCELNELTITWKKSGDIDQIVTKTRGTREESSDRGSFRVLGQTETDFDTSMSKILTPFVPGNHHLSHQFFVWFH